MATFMSLSLELREQIYDYCWWNTRYIFEDRGTYFSVTYKSTRPPQLLFDNWTKHNDGIPLWVITNKSILHEALGQFYRHAICHSCISLENLTYFQPNWITGYRQSPLPIVCWVFNFEHIRYFNFDYPGLFLKGQLGEEDVGSWDPNLDVYVRPVNIRYSAFDNTPFKHSGPTSKAKEPKIRVLQLTIFFQKDAKVPRFEHLDKEKCESDFHFDLSHLSGWTMSFSRIVLTIQESPRDIYGNCGSCKRYPCFRCECARCYGDDDLLIENDSLEAGSACSKVISLLQDKLLEAAKEMIGFQDWVASDWIGRLWTFPNKHDDISWVRYPEKPRQTLKSWSLEIKGVRNSTQDDG